MSTRERAWLPRAALAASGNLDVVVEEHARVVGVETVVARAPAELARTETRVTDRGDPDEHRTAGVPEARAAVGARVLLVLGELQDNCEEMFWPTASATRRVRSATAVGFCGPSVGFSKKTP